MEKRRVISVAVIAISLLVFVAWVRPVEDHGLPISNFWASKFSNSRDYDIVAAGDSRILHGINMEPFSRLGLGRGFNFGFRGSPATEEYYSAAIKNLGDDGQRILVLGVTPNAFTEYARYSNGFDQKKTEYLGRSPAIPYWIGAAEQRMQPMTLGEGYRILSRKRNPLQLTFHDDGWIESTHEKPNEDFSLRFYNVHFDNNQALPENVLSTCEYLKQCIEKRIRVFAFRPPLSKSMQDVEDTTSGFDYEQFVEHFSKIGGVWIEVEPSEFHTYDGSHLNSKSAREFSSWLAEEIKVRIDEATEDDEG